MIRIGKPNFGRTRGQVGFEIKAYWPTAMDYKDEPWLPWQFTFDLTFIIWWFSVDVYWPGIRGEKHSCAPDRTCSCGTYWSQ